MRLSITSFLEQSNAGTIFGLIGSAKLWALVAVCNLNRPMAILSMFYSVIIPIENLRRILAKEELQKAFMERSHKGKIWFDDYLYREGSMNPADNEAIIKFWEDKGLVPVEMKNGKKHWKDLCLVQCPELEPTLPCDWIEVFYEDVAGRNLYVNLKGKPRGRLVREPADMPIDKNWDIDRQRPPLV